MRRRAGLILALLLAPAVAAANPSRPVVWAWERPEDLRFLPPDVEIAAQTGFVELAGEGVMARGRRFPLRAATGQIRTAVVHVQIAARRPLAWTPAQRQATAQAVVRLGLQPGIGRVQVDFEVRRSQRQVLLDLLGDVRRRLPRGVALSMTALASWCDTEAWLNQAPVDEITPMLFRMGPGGGALKAKLEAGGDFANLRCRTALAVSADAPLARAPGGRRVYMFSPRGWTAADYQMLRRRISEWPSNGD